MPLPFYVRRPWLIVRGTFANRDRPPLDALAAIRDPVEFVWAMLPHAARSFATSILVLPEREAWAAAIAYLQCRILDTYEDLHPDVAARPQLLRRVGRHWSGEYTEHLEPIPPAGGRTPRDEVHILLTERIDLIDAAYASLSPPEQASIDQLVGNMAEGMAWAAETFAGQGRVLEDGEQRARYCHYVIGEPALYAMRSLLHLEQTPRRRNDALDVAVMIQMANITRDIEKDLARGVAYHPALRPLLRAEGDNVAATVRTVRDQLIREALGGVDGYVRLVNDLPAGLSQARGAAVLMLDFTDRYYSGAVRKAGYSGWRRTPRPIMYADSILATISATWAGRSVQRAARRFHGFLAEPVPATPNQG